MRRAREDSRGTSTGLCESQAGRSLDQTDREQCAAAEPSGRMGKAVEHPLCRQRTQRGRVLVDDL